MIKLISGLGLFFGFLINSKNVANENRSPYTQVVDSLLKYVDKSAIKSNILYDRAMPFARLDEFRPNIDTTSYQHFRQGYSELYMSHYQPKGKLISPDDFEAVVEWNRFNNILPIGVIDMSYQQLDPDALSKKTLMMRNGRLHNTSVVTSSPYLTRHLQMATLLADQIKPGRQIIKWNPKILLSNTGVKVESINLYFSNGIGSYTLTEEDSAIVNFKEDEVVNLHATVKFEDGQTFNSNSAVNVEKVSFMKSEYISTLPTGACRKEIVVADIPFEGYDELAPLKGQVEVNYYYRAGENDNTNCIKKLSKPVIVLDGFDPTDKRDADFIYNYNFKYITKEGKPSNFADELRMKGHDVIIINMPKYKIGTRNIALADGDSIEIGTLMRAGGDYIERNGLVLIKVLQNINTELAEQGSKEKVVIVGPSMGGIISRYALTYMENHKMTHNCGLWVSWDATHLGSVFPIGEQYYIKSMADLGLRGAKDGINQQINTTASKQELNHHHLAETVEPEGAPGFKERFYGSLDNMGFPKECRKIAMISGAINGALQPQGVASGTAFDFKLKMNKKPRLLLLNVLALVANPDFISAKIKFSPALKDGNKRSEIFSMKVLGIPVHKEYVMPFQLSNNSVELIPGGWYPGFKEIRDSTRTKMHGFMNWLVDPQFVNVTENHCHQPTANTLALGLGPHPNPNRKWDDDLSQVNFNCGDEKETPWDAYYAPDINLRHDSLTYEYAWRMMDEINGIHMPQPKPVKQLAINGNISLMVPGEVRRYIVTNKDKTVSYKWSVSDNGLKIIAGQGTDTLTVQYMGNISGTCSIVCKGEGNCYEYASKAFTIEKFDNAASGNFTQLDTHDKVGALVSILPNQVRALTTYELVDAQGRIIATQNAGVSDKTVFNDVPLQKTGMYVIRTSQGNTLLSERKMIVK